MNFPQRTFRSPYHEMIASYYGLFFTWWKLHVLIWKSGWAFSKILFTPRLLKGEMLFIFIYFFDLEMLSFLRVSSEYSTNTSVIMLENVFKVLIGHALLEGSHRPYDCMEASLLFVRRIYLYHRNFRTLFPTYVPCCRLGHTCFHSRVPRILFYHYTPSAEATWGRNTWE